MRISSIAALLLIGTTSMMAETAPESEEMFSEPELPIHYEEALPYETDGIVAEGTEGTSNTYYGLGAGYVNLGSNNSFFGRYAGYANTGTDNTFTGAFSGGFNTTGSRNTFSGMNSGSSNTIGNFNTFYGVASGPKNTTGNWNTFIGHQSGFKNTTGLANTFIGNSSGLTNTEGSYNTFGGKGSGQSNKTGHHNTFYGVESGTKNTGGSYNIFLGFRAGWNTTSSNTLYIENSDTTTPLIYGEFDNDLVRVNGTFETVWAGSNTEGDGLTNLLLLSADNSEEDLASDAGFALLNAREGKQWNFRTANGGDAFSATIQGTSGTEFKVTNTTNHFSGVQLHLGNGAKNVGGVWINASSRELKENIKELSSQDALAAFHKLQPVTYNYKSDKKEQVVGFIAEDVPELVAIQSRDGLSSMDMVAVLTKVVQEQEKNNELLQQRVGEQEHQLTATKTQLETMQQKVAHLESILTNLALDTSNASKEKVSLK